MVTQERPILIVSESEFSRRNIENALKTICGDIVYSASLEAARASLNNENFALAVIAVEPSETVNSPLVRLLRFARRKKVCSIVLYGEVETRDIEEAIDSLHLQKTSPVRRVS